MSSRFGVLVVRVDELSLILLSVLPCVYCRRCCPAGRCCVAVEGFIAMYPRYLSLDTGASILSLAASQATVSLEITAQPTAGASDFISPSFASFGIEPSNLSPLPEGRNRMS